jgi:hypothetical protein
VFARMRFQATTLLSVSGTLSLALSTPLVVRGPSCAPVLGHAPILVFYIEQTRCITR